MQNVNYVGPYLLSLSLGSCVRYFAFDAKPGSTALALQDLVKSSSALPREIWLLATGTHTFAVDAKKYAARLRSGPGSPTQPQIEPAKGRESGFCRQIIFHSI